MPQMYSLLRSRHCCVIDRVAACQGGGLVLDADLSMQQVQSPELQALARKAGLPVELRCDSP